MITILKSGYGKILKLFYEKKGKLHLREICRQTKLHEPSASRFLSQLEKEHILQSEREANLKKYSIRRNGRSYLIFEMFDLERFEKLPRIRRDAIAGFYAALPEKPIFMIVFGSTAKGSYREDSDIDILLVTNKKINTPEAEKEVDAITGIKISTFQITHAQFLKEIKLKEDKVIASAVNSGFPLTNHIKYYEALNEGI